ncbi:tetratricopeptide repeat protein [Ekhidna sp.]|uniref:tetratricopeptide repeat protein n=1 Tax=Ekhidna sp. TaxID=2608089 RepID=UPI003B50D7B2
MRKYILLLSVLVFACESSEERTERFFQMGNIALRDGNYENAIELYNQSLKESPNYAPALNNRGVARIESDHPYEAILDYNQAIQIDPNYLDALFNRAYAYEEIGQFENAIKDVETIQSMVSDSAFVYFYQGLVQTKMRQYDEALKSFQVADGLNPLNPETLINTATIYYFKSALDTAVSLVNKALELNANDANAYSLLSLIELKKGNYTAAIAEVNRALDLVPGEPYFLNNRGYIYLQMDSLEAAIEDINRSIVLNPRNGWAYRNKGIYMMKNASYLEAIDLLERAEKTGEFIDELYFYLGNAHKEAGNTQKACDAWKKGKDLNESESERFYNQNCG